MFGLLGLHAYSLINIIDIIKHDIIISSHPSGLSCDKPMRNYESFANTDHFGIINKKLIKNGLYPIIWGLTVD